MTPQELNEINRRFWSKQRTLLAEGMADDVLRTTAFELMNDELCRGVPTKSQLSIYQAFTNVTAIARQFRTEQARKGGKALKTDALHVLIEQIVSRRPNMTCPELIEQLQADTGIAPIEDVDGDAIHFTDHYGRSNQAPLTGLKDRLSRAKKKIRSR
jgi:hypothetical protein